MTTIIHVNKGNILRNNKLPDGQRLPVLRAQDETGETLYGDRIDIVNEDGETVATFVYSPDKPLQCGAKVWVETELDVVVAER